jgi:hypothetical protein
VGLLSLLVSCLPGRGGPLSQATPIEPILPPSYELVAGQTAIDTFDPPGAGAKVSLTIATQVINPNDFGIRLKQINYDIFLGGKKIARQSLELDQFILGGAQVPLKFPVTVSLENQLELMTAVARAFTGTSLAFKLEGETVFTSQSYEFKSRFTTLVEGSTLAREAVKSPELRLEESSSGVVLVREDAPVIKVTVLATNPGDVGYFLYGKDVSVSLNGEVLDLEDINPVPIPAGQDSRFELLFYPSYKNLTEAGRVALEAAIAGIPTTLEVQGELLIDVLGVDTFKVPSGWKISGFVYR